MRAEFAELDVYGTVWLRRWDGERIKIDFANLSERDQQYVQDRVGTARPRRQSPAPPPGFVLDDPPNTANGSAGGRFDDVLSAPRSRGRFDDVLLTPATDTPLPAGKPPPAATESEFKQVTTKSGITFQIPATWEQIPPDTLAAHAKAAAQKAPGTTPQTFETGFQSPATRWLEYPYVLVSIQHSGRVTDAALRGLPKLRGTLKGAMSDKAASVSVLTEASLGETLYDPSTGVLWMSARMDYEGVGKIALLSGGHRTEDGLVQVMGVARAETMTQHESTLRRIIASAELPDGIRYQARPLDAVPLLGRVNWDKAATKAIAGGIIGAVKTGH